MISVSTFKVMLLWCLVRLPAALTVWRGDPQSPSWVQRLLKDPLRIVCLVGAKELCHRECNSAGQGKPAVVITKL